LVGSAFAFFEDTEESTDNTFEMGTWAVETDGGGNTASNTFSNLEAGDSGMKTWTVTNTGTVPAYVDMSINVKGSGTGNLADLLLVHIYVAGYAGNIYGSADSLLPISGAGGYYDLNLVLESSVSLVIALDWTVNGSYQHDDSDEVVFSMKFSIQPTP
jgi:hypothetical protein